MSGSQKPGADSLASQLRSDNRESSKRGNQPRVRTMAPVKPLEQLRNPTRWVELKPKVGAGRPNNPCGERIMDRKKLTGAFLAAAVGAMFLTTPLFAQESTGSSPQATTQFLGGTLFQAQRRP